MTEQETEKIAKGTVVMWDNDPGYLGVVRDIGSSGLYIDWITGIIGWLPFSQLDKISIRQEREDA